MDTSADDRQRLAEALAKLTPDQKERYNRWTLLRQANGEQTSVKLQFEIAETFAKGMPERETRDEIRDKERKSASGLDNIVPIKDRPPNTPKTAQMDTPKTLDAIIKQAEKEVAARQQQAAEKGLTRGDDHGQSR